jgi:DNA-binding transcriptional ArsR family regulator
MHTLMAITKALADENRVRIMLALEGRSLRGAIRSNWLRTYRDGIYEKH